MAKFNTGPSRRAPAPALTTEVTPSTSTEQGGPGFHRDPRTELFLSAVTALAGESSFYETAVGRDTRVISLTRQLAVQDQHYPWLLAFLLWLRQRANIRSTGLLIAAQAVHARLEAGLHGGNRDLIRSALGRADEPGEMLAYWQSTFGRALPMPVKRGIADAAIRLYTEYSYLKWDSTRRPYRFADVLNLTHPGDRRGSRQELRGNQRHLFPQILDDRHGHAGPGQSPAALSMLAARRRLLNTPIPQRRALLLSHSGPEILEAAGATWEFVAGWVQGELDAALWERLIPRMGYMALLRNLANFDRAGISEAAATQVIERLTDPGQVAGSRQLPLRFLAAHRQVASLRWGPALETALNLSLSNVPRLSGRTLVLVDQSGSMMAPLSARSTLLRAHAAAVFGAALALRAEQADLVQYGTYSQVVPVSAGAAVLRVADQFRDLGGTQTEAALRAHYRQHDRVVILTDEQAAGFWGPASGDSDRAFGVLAGLPPHVWAYTCNLAGYRSGHAPVRGRHYLIGGLTDHMFGAIPLIEAGQAQRWPWEEQA